MTHLWASSTVWCQGDISIAVSQRVSLEAASNTLPGRLHPPGIVPVHYTVIMPIHCTVKSAITLHSENANTVHSEVPIHYTVKMQIHYTVKDLYITLTI